MRQTTLSPVKGAKIGGALALSGMVQVNAHVCPILAKKSTPQLASK